MSADRKKEKTDDPVAWGRIARRDLLDARILIDDASYENAAFHAQQCVEKAIKGLLVARGVVPKFTHDVALLLEALRLHEAALAGECEEAADLTIYSVRPRYPYAYEVTGEDAESAIAIACRVYEVARRALLTRDIVWPELPSR